MVELLNTVETEVEEPFSEVIVSEPLLHPLCPAQVPGHDVEFCGRSTFYLFDRTCRKCQIHTDAHLAEDMLDLSKLASESVSESAK